jgi:hypothetical protein
MGDGETPGLRVAPEFPKLGLGVLPFVEGRDARVDGDATRGEGGASVHKGTLS